jgi:hypothetical protein
MGNENRFPGTFRGHSKRPNGTRLHQDTEFKYPRDVIQEEAVVIQEEAVRARVKTAWQKQSNFSNFILRQNDTS